MRRRGDALCELAAPGSSQRPESGSMPADILDRSGVRHVKCCPMKEIGATGGADGDDWAEDSSSCWDASEATADASNTKRKGNGWEVAQSKEALRERIIFSVSTQKPVARARPATRDGGAPPLPVRAPGTSGAASKTGSIARRIGAVRPVFPIVLVPTRQREDKEGPPRKQKEAQRPKKSLKEQEPPPESHRRT